MTPLASITGLADLGAQNLADRSMEYARSSTDETGMWRLYITEHYYLMRELTRRLNDDRLGNYPSPRADVPAIPDRGNTLLRGAA